MGQGLGVAGKTLNRLVPLARVGKLPDADSCGLGRLWQAGHILVMGQRLSLVAVMKGLQEIHFIASGAGGKVLPMMALVVLVDAPARVIVFAKGRAAQFLGIVAQAHGSEQVRQGQSRLQFFNCCHL